MNRYLGNYIIGHVKRECFKVLKIVDEIVFLQIDYHTNVIQIEKNKKISWDYSNTMNSDTPEFSFYNVSFYKI